MLQRILFFGNERLATGISTSAPVLQALVQAGYDIAAVVVAQHETGKSRTARDLEIAAVAQQHGIPLLAPAKLSEVIDELKTYDAEAAVLVAYGKIVPQSLIDIFPRGIINIHPSLLPRHRGPTPLESVILHGDSETGVTLMALGAKMDAGPIYAQQSVELRGDETKQQLADQLLGVGRDMLIASLPAILDGSLQPTVQDEKQATYDQLIEKGSGALGNLGWNEPSADVIRKLRAYSGWPRLRTTLGNTEIIITGAHITDGSGLAGTLWLGNKQFGIYTADGVFVIDSLIPGGKKEMSAAAFLAGYKLF